MPTMVQQLAHQMVTPQPPTPLVSDAHVPDDLVHHLLEDHVNNITGKDNMSDVDSMQDGCDTTLDYKLTEKQRDRIRADQYIDFDLLIENTAKQSMKVQPSAEGSGVIVNQVDEASHWKIKRVDSWVSAFAIYAYVTLQTRPL